MATETKLLDFRVTWNALLLTDWYTDLKMTPVNCAHERSLVNSPGPH